MATVLLVRHGETDWNRERRIQGWAPTRLSDAGREQASALGRAVTADHDVTRLLSSDLPRTRETAEHIGAAVGVDPELDRRWRERDFGVYQGLTYDELDERVERSVARWGVNGAARHPESGEPLGRLRDRVLEGWRALLADLDEGTAVVVTHGGPLYVVVGRLRGLDLDGSVREVEQDNCAVNEVRIDGDGAALVRANDPV